MNGRKLIVYISMSLDGYLARKNDDISWLSMVEKKGEDYGYNDFTASIDTYIVGRATYDYIIKLIDHFPQAKKFDCYVITRKDRKPEDGVKFYNGDLEALINNLKKKEGKNIYCDGGGEIVRLLMEKRLIDEFIISIIPIVLGDGKRLFKGGVPEDKLELLNSKQYDTGLVQLHYKRK
ncbi:dihydrofolate reductase family protein [Fulvivirgaceae bacterium BMA10]|uniref:Dihydrofolate reductase family protein n=1 Tax=Splendidivirga corallicola TaxID=3051826 RepID=A0ABT8KHP0_9BACT|nr:dihydrofolate reductase family protein [Fulvivirgaceae bacterium BMA10]